MPLPKLNPATIAPPGRHIVLLPDEHFFVRTVPLTSGEGATDVRTQVELALEAAAPFPLAQLYYGYWTRPGTGRVLVFAAYRKRFGTEEVEEWATADLVTPRFAVLLAAAPPESATTWVLPAEGGFTAIHFGDGSGVPVNVRVEPVPPGADATARAAARERLLRGLGGSRAVIDLPAVEVVPSEPGDGDYVARSEAVRSQFTMAQAEAIDVRDKADLTARRRARTRDRWLWRGLVLGLVAIIGCALVELGLIGLHAWQGRQLAVIARQTPVVNEIMTAQSLATRIEELSTRRLRPFEMIAVADGPRPDSIQFTSTTTSGLYTLNIQAQTTAQSDIDTYRSTLAARPEIETVDIEPQGVRNNIATFRMAVTFSPAAFETSAPASP